MSRAPCPVCDFPLATEADDEVLSAASEAGRPTDDIALFADVLCWSEFVAQHRDGELGDGVKHWRARALKAEAALPRFESDCDRECEAVVFKAGYAHPVRHSPFCKHGVSR